MQLLHLDTQLYIDILSTLQLNQTENLPWDAVVSKIKTLVQAKKPNAWAGIDEFLKSLHSAHNASPAFEDDLNDDDDVLEMIEGVDYLTDEMDEQELGEFPEGEDYDYDQHYAAFLKDVQDHSGHNVLDEFANLNMDNQVVAW